MNDTGLQWLHNLCYLEYVDLSFCHWVNDAGISDLRAVLPRCKVGR
ncbi:hypothetical protein [Vreelandella sp. TE19]